MTLPVHVVALAPAGAFPAMHFNLFRREDAVRRLRKFLESIAEIEAMDAPTSTHVLLAMHFHHAVDALLDGMLEVIRCEQDGEIEAWWCESWPGTAPPEWPADQSSGEAVAA